MMNKQKQESKPIIESIINTVALALTSYGVLSVTTGLTRGYFAIAFGLSVEYLKYYGRNKNLW